jgi:hypothetical protein
MQRLLLESDADFHLIEVYRKYEEQRQEIEPQWRQRYEGEKEDKQHKNGRRNGEKTRKKNKQKERKKIRDQKTQKIQKNNGLENIMNIC